MFIAFYAINANFFVCQNEIMVFLFFSMPHGAHGGVARAFILLVSILDGCDVCVVLFLTK